MLSPKVLCFAIVLCCVPEPAPQFSDKALEALGDVAEYLQRAERQIDRAQELHDLGRMAAARATWDSARGVLAAMAQAVRDADAAIGRVATQPEAPFGPGMRRFIVNENASRVHSIVKVRVLAIEEYWRDEEDEAEARRRRDLMPGFEASVEVLEIHTIGRFLWGPRRFDLFVGGIISVYSGGTLPVFAPEDAVRMEDLDVDGVFWVAIGPPVAPRLPQLFMSCGKSGLGFLEAALK